jgi:ribosomal protein L11 methyltransferase
LAEARHWPALVVRAAKVDETDALEGLVTLALDGCQPLAIEDLTPLPIPPGGLWEPTAPAAPPPAPLAWRLCFKDDADRSRAAQAIAALGHGLVVESMDLPDDDWVARSQQALSTITAGPFVIAPPWDIPDPIPAGQRLIVIEPSMGFGTGHHATTRLCLRALGAVDVTGLQVLDIGTGSGVLALAAASSGATAVTGVDIDEDAIAAALRSAALNPAVPAVHFRTGDIAAPGEPADLVLANLTGAMLTRSADYLARAVVPGGLLIISGFMHDERDDVEAALSAFALEARFDEDGWCAATLRRRQD